MQEFPKMLYSAAGEIIVNSREEQDDKDPALWFERLDQIPVYVPESEPEDPADAGEAADPAAPVKRGPGRPRKVV